MKKIAVRAALAALIVLSPVSQLNAGCGVRSCVVHRQAVAAVAVVDTILIPQFIQIPLYSVTVGGYQAPVAPPAAQVPAPVPVDLNNQPSPCDAKLTDLQRRFDSLQRDFESLRQAQGGPAAKPSAVPGPKVPKSAGKCFACHSEAAAVKDGGRFVMFKGAGAAAILLGPNEMPARKVVKVLTMTNANQMPPPKNGKGIAPLTDEEAAEWQEWASSIGDEKPAAVAPEKVPAPPAAKEPKP